MKDFNSFYKLEYEEENFVAFDYGWNENLNIGKNNNNGSSVCIYYIAKMDGFRILCFQLMKMKLKRRRKTATWEILTWQVINNCQNIP
jgi:hypothetical protein